MSAPSNSFEVLLTLNEGGSSSPAWRPSTRDVSRAEERAGPRKKGRPGANVARPRGITQRRARMEIRSTATASPREGTGFYQTGVEKTVSGTMSGLKPVSHSLSSKTSISGPAPPVRAPAVPKPVVPSSFVIISDPAAVPAACAALSTKSRIAVDCEGVLLSRKGKLCLVQVASVEAVYMFDIVAGGSAIFDAGLRDILQSSKCIKVMHDCRYDCDALMHQYNVRLEPVIDTQIAFSTLRSVRRLKVGLPVSLKTLLRKFVQVSEDDLEVKDSIKTKMREQEDFWMTRPLPPEALQYAKFDVMYLLHLTKVLAIYITSVDKQGWERVLTESAAYSRLFRDDSEGPRKEAAKWARMLTEAKADRAVYERKKATEELRSVDPMCVFSFDSGSLSACFSPRRCQERAT